MIFAMFLCTVQVGETDGLVSEFNKEKERLATIITDRLLQRGQAGVGRKRLK